MEIKAEPVMKRDLQEERMYFWEKMIWQHEERKVERNQLYYRATQFVFNKVV